MILEFVKIEYRTVKLPGQNYKIDVRTQIRFDMFMYISRASASVRVCVYKLVY